MKIGFMVNYFYPATGGEEELTFTLSKELVRRGHEVHVFTSDRKDGILFPSEEVIEGINIHRSRVWFGYRIYLRWNPNIAYNHFKYDLDVLHVMSLGFFFQDLAVLLRSVFTKTRLVNTPHGPFMALESYPVWQGVFRAMYRAFEFPINRLYHAVIEDNPSQRLWMPRFGFHRDRIHYVPPPVPDTIFKKFELEERRDLQGKFVLSYLGRVQKYKGLEQVIRVLPALKKVKKNVLFVMMGSSVDDERERLQAIARELHVEENILFTGRVSDEEKVSILDSSEIFIFPSEWEAFGIVMVEAMARSCAIISSKTEGGLFLVRDGVEGFLFDYQDVRMLEEKLLLLVRDDILRKKMQVRNRSRAKEFAVSRVVLDVEKVYDSLVAQ